MTPEDVPDEVLAPLLAAGEQEGPLRALLAVALPIAHERWAKSWASKLHAEADRYEETHNPDCECEWIQATRDVADQLETAAHPWWSRYAAYLRPMAGDEVEEWLLRHREADEDPQFRTMVDDLIEDYRDHARHFLTLDQEVPREDF